MNKFVWVLILVILIFLISSNKETFEDISIYSGAYDTNLKIVSVCQNKFQPCNLYRY